MKNYYIFKYDLDKDMNPVKGEVKLSQDGRMELSEDGKDTGVHFIKETKEALVISGCGCGLILLKMEDASEILLCRFSMSAIGEAGEFCKIINYSVQNENFRIPTSREISSCPKCKRPFPEGMKVCLFCYDKLGVLKRTIKLMEPFKWKMLPSQLIMAISSVLFLLVPVFSRHLIDDYLRPMTGTAGQILFLAGAMLLARALGEAMFILSSRIYNKAGIEFVNHLRNITYAGIQKLSLKSLSKRTPGDLIRRVMEDTENIKNFLADGGRWAVEQIIMSIIVMVILFITNPYLALLVFIPIPVVIFVLTRFWKLIHIRYERQWRRHSVCQSILHDIIKGIRTVKSFGREKDEIEKFSKATKDLAVVSSENECIWAALFPLVTFFTGIGEFFVLYFGGRAILGDELSFGVLVLFTMYITYLYAPLRWLVSFPRWLADALTSLVKIYEILDEEEDLKNPEFPVSVPVEGSISFSGVCFGYKSYEPVLNDIDVDISPGEMIGIVGRSGAGKSTMINLLMRLYDPDRGTILINGKDIRDMDSKYLHDKIGVVFQDTFLFAGTFYENIAYSKKDATLDEVIAAAKAANAHEFIMNTSDGYNTVIGENGQTLSGGEKQRLAIARAIIKDPSLIILDEATSSLDVETESLIQDSLDRIIKGRTTIAIAHRLSTLKKADRLLVLDQGRIAEFGTHIELLKKKGIYYSLVMAQRQTGKPNA